MKNNSNEYDAVIIGAGIGGLVCGCYLAKAGMKVLIAEQHNKPGGYCTSFKRGDFTFPAAAHYLGGFKFGNLDRIFRELELYNDLKITKYEPSNIIITPDNKISIWSDINKTVEEFSVHFPKENKAISKFFSLLLKNDYQFSVGTRNQTFQKLLNDFFSCAKLKTVLSFPIFGNSALPPNLISAFMANKILREYIVDGGYYIKGGIQMLPFTLMNKFIEFGGEILLSCYVKKIKIKDNKVTGIIIDSREFIKSKYVISNGDAMLTFCKLIGEKNINKSFLNNIKKMLPSLSGYIAYIGLDKEIAKNINKGTNIWLLNNSVLNINKNYSQIKNGVYNKINGYLLYISPDYKKIMAFLVAPFKDKFFWDYNKHILLEKLINKIENDLIPRLSEKIIFKDAATPQTLHRYTLNHKGAAFGWACIPSQLALTYLRKPFFIDNLYLTGHWVTKGFGIPGVAYIGEDTAKMIIRKETTYNKK